LKALEDSLKKKKYYRSIGKNIRMSIFKEFGEFCTRFERAGNIFGEGKGWGREERTVSERLS